MTSLRTAGLGIAGLGTAGLRSAGLVLPLLGVACSWTRFDDVSTDTPVVSLNAPDTMHSGFGVTLAWATSEDGESSHLLVGGTAESSPASAFELGTHDAPGMDAFDTAFCDEFEACRLATQVAGLGTADSPGKPREQCFALGAGFVDTTGLGILIRCNDQAQYTVAVPPDVEEWIDRALGRDEGPEIALHSDSRQAPALVAAAPERGLAWFYAPESRRLEELLTPADVGESYGRVVASAALDGAHLFAIAEPDEGRVFLFRSDDGDEGYRVGCLGGPPGFGRTMTTGLVDDDELDELVIADDVNVHVFGGAGLSELSATDSEECSLASLPPETLIASFGCGSNENVSGCDTSGFGAALAVGDLDGDEDGEVVVGAPSMNVRGEAAVGAVLVYDVEGDDPFEFSDIKFSSSAETGARIGAALSAPRVGDHNVVAAGGPGGGDTFLFYCLNLPDGTTSHRCN